MSYTCSESRSSFFLFFKEGTLTREVLHVRRTVPGDVL